MNFEKLSNLTRKQPVVAGPRSKTTHISNLEHRGGHGMACGPKSARCLLAVLLEHSYTPVFSYCLQLLLHYNGRAEYLGQRSYDL